MPDGAGVVRYAGKRGVVWRIKWKDAAGKQLMETIGAERDGVTRKTAEAELRERLVKVERRGWRKPAPLTFADYARTWLAEGKRRRRWRPGSTRVYRVACDRLIRSFGGKQLAAVRPRDVAAYVADVSADYAPATVSRDVSLLHAIFASALREELVDANPAAGAERPKDRPRQWRILEPAEVVRVAKAFTDGQARAAFLTLVLTGVRRHELTGLRWRDVDLLEAVLRVRASKSEEGIRSIAVSSRLAEELQGHWQRTAFRGDDERVFCHPETGGPFDPAGFRDDLNAALMAAGVDGYVRPFHDLRHSSLTNGAAAGEGAIALMARAGHANMAVTKRYLHLAGTVFRDEADALERRMLGELSTELSTDLSASEGI